MTQALPGFARTAAAAALCLLGMLAAQAGRAGEAPVPAFPGAVGFGVETPGGRGGPVVRVTTLLDAGPGSLRAALEGRSDPRMVVFAVGGTIALEREIAVGGNVTVLGQTAPAPGVTLTGARLKVVGGDVILRGLRVRPGGALPGQALGQRDGISVGGPDSTVRRVVVAQNSISWATDENLATWNAVEDVTFARNIVAEALNEAGHPEGAHSMGMLVGPRSRRVSIVQNVFASNRWRNPQIRGLAEGEVVNNVVHNYGPGALSVGGGATRIDVVGNLFSAGPDTPDPFTRAPIHIAGKAPDGLYHVEGNLMPMVPDTVRGDGPDRLSAEPVAGRAALSAFSAYDLPGALTDRVGARLPAVDPIDRRILDDVLRGRGAVVDAPPADVGTAVAAAGQGADQGADRDGDLIPDAWELRIGSDPDRPDAGALAPTGYAFVEAYVDALDP